MSNVPVKYFTAVLTGDTSLLPDILKRLEKYFGEADFISGWFDFSFTGFYEEEMGKDLKRCLVSFKKLLPPQYLPKAKRWTQKIEEKFKRDGRRRVNIDAGYIDFCKAVLASGKFGGHKIAMTKECCADMVLSYEKGEFKPLPWCFPDFRSGIYNEALFEMRRLLKG